MIKRRLLKSILLCFGLLLMFVALSEKAQAVASRYDPEILQYSFVYQESGNDSVAAKLVDDDGDSVKDASVVCSQMDKEGITIDSSQINTDKKGLATCYIKDDTVVKIKLVYREQFCLIANLHRETNGISAGSTISSLLAFFSISAVAAAAGLGALGAAATQLGLKDYLFVLMNYLLTAFAFSKKSKMGIVYDSSTQKPIQGAIVHLYEVPAYRLVASAITNSHGGYVFSAKEGEYALSVIKPGFQFPSKAVRSLGDSSGVYVGQIVRVSQANPAINVLIPIDPDANSSVVVSRLYRVAHSGFFRYGLLLFSSATSIYSLWSNPSLISYLLCGAIVVLWIMELITFNRVIKYSRVVDNNSRKPVELALVRVVNEDGKFAETFVTDQKGRVLPKISQRGQKILVEKAGYQTAQFQPRGEGIIERRRFEVLQS